MNIVLTHTTALEYWRIARTFPVPQPQDSRICTPGGALSDAEARSLCSALPLSSPIHLLVSANAKRSRSKSVVFHTRDERLPSGSLAVVGDGHLISSPGLLLTQEAQSVDTVELVFLGHELCGTYSTIEAPPEMRYGQTPKTTLARLRAFLDRADGLRGVKQARRAARYILPNSASPAESALSMAFTLPNLLGGASLSSPRLNYRIDPGKNARRDVGQDYYTCDLFWEKARLAVEYDSDLFHTGSHRIAQDSKRRDDLARLGITVLTVTTRQFSNFQEFTRLVGTVAKLLGERLQPRDKDFATRQIRLHSLLWSLLSQRPTQPALAENVAGTIARATAWGSQVRAADPRFSVQNFR
ncbi:hypothetical protein [Arabiibacter massiliensis]|uniref:hypothetical protein n=1 Tax=Arabiibacter massiliensis TaxID=1870985 RepID=UPI00117BD726|nr:hypothetical protein [Arabiibacter massiliensis]